MDIECERCGNCCPTDCEDLEVTQEESRMTSCKLHETGRQSPACLNPPYRLFRYGIACRACITHIREEIDETVGFDTFIDPSGHVAFKRDKIPREVFVKMAKNGDGT